MVSVAVAAHTIDSVELTENVIDKVVGIENFLHFLCVAGRATVGQC